MRLTSRRGLSERRCSLGACRITASTAAACSTRCWSPASESTRSFTLGVVLDLEHPFHAAQDLLAPALVVPIEDGPPSIGASGWLAQVDHKGVAVSHVEFVKETSDGRGWGLIFHLLETAGQSARCRLRLFRNPSWARQADFLGETIVDLSIDGDAVSIDLTPHELARIEVTMG